MSAKATKTESHELAEFMETVNENREFWNTTCRDIWPIVKVFGTMCRRL